MPSDPSPDRSHIPESAFGIWFLRTETWGVHVLERALADLERLVSQRGRSHPVILDAGCGNGRSFRLLKEKFAPARVVGVDIDPEMIADAEAEAHRRDIPVELHCADLAHLPLGDGSVDLLLCHQTFHHLVAQRETLGEFHRVLRPGGLLLFAESTRFYIHSWIIRLLFRHPTDVQRDADEYIDMVRRAGFHIDADAVSYPYLWWSRPDLGLREQVFGIKPAHGHPETLVNLVATRI
ncbi:MAG: class I SAM-dependent methyltransferase [Rhizomicrobium sp.]|jgi:SAM-dependent methyltransferase